MCYIIDDGVGDVYVVTIPWKKDEISSIYNNKTIGTIVDWLKDNDIVNWGYDIKSHDATRYGKDPLRAEFYFYSKEDAFKFKMAWK